MRDEGKRLLSLMFRPGETICVSNSKYGYHSIPLEEVINSPIVTLVPTQESCDKRGIEWKLENFEKSNTEDLLLAAINPIYGFREDSNCIAFRNFMVEMDSGSLPEQKAYVNARGMPYSACIFSGNKSLHYLISVDQDIPSEKTWRMFAEWILNIMTAADPLTKNPSRSIRIPGAYREPGKKQILVDFKGPIKMSELVSWLSKFPQERPKKHEKKQPVGEFDFGRIKPWVKISLVNGIDSSKSRNQTWFAIACEFYLAGYNFDDSIEIMEQYFVPEKDFKEKEWRNTVKSAHKYIQNRK